MRNKVTRQCPQTTTFLKRKESRSGIEPARPDRLTVPVLVWDSLQMMQTRSGGDTVGLGTGSLLSLIVITIMEICKAPTLRLKALNK